MIQEAAEKKRLEEEERIRQEKRDANGKNFKDGVIDRIEMPIYGS